MPEKMLSAIPRPLRERYEKGKEAMDRKVWDYALAIFAEVLEQEPEFYECREKLRGIQLTKAASGTTFFKKMFDTASHSTRLAKAQLTLRNDPREAMKLAEQILAADPRNSSAHRLLADAALKLEMPKTAVLSLEIAYDEAPLDKALALRLCEALVAAGQPARAEATFAQVAQAYPNDPKVSQAFKNFAATKTLHEGGYETIGGGEGSFRDILRDPGQIISPELENQEIKADDTAALLIREYEARLLREPGNLRLLRSIGELHLQRKEFDQALACYERILKAEGAVDPSLEQAIAQTTARKYDHQISKLDANDPESAEKRAGLIVERDEFRLRECQSRALKYPNDLLIRFELGQLYLDAGKLPQAMQEFQRAQAHPNRKIPALNGLGQCFSQRGMHDLAANTFRAAIKEKVVFDDEKKDLVYRLGLSLERLGKSEEAMEQFKTIYQADIGYRDVAARVEGFYSPPA